MSPVDLRTDSSSQFAVITFTVTRHCPSGLKMPDNFLCSTTNVSKAGSYPLTKLIVLNSLRWFCHVLLRPAHRQAFCVLFARAGQGWKKWCGSQVRTWDRDMKRLASVDSSRLYRWGLRCGVVVDWGCWETNDMDWLMCRMRFFSSKFDVCLIHLNEMYHCKFRQLFYHAASHEMMLTLIWLLYDIETLDGWLILSRSSLWCSL